MKTQQRRMIAHGAIVILIALASGFGLVMSLIGGFEIIPGTILTFEIPGDSRAWARAHAGGILNGLLVIAGALVTHAMALPQQTASRLYWMLVGTGYGWLQAVTNFATHEMRSKSKIESNMVGDASKLGRRAFSVLTSPSTRGQVLQAA